MSIMPCGRNDLDTMSLDDLYNHLKVYESEVQKKSDPNSQNMAFISSAKHNSENKDGNTVCVPTASTNVPTASASVATISQDTAYAYIASQSSGSQIKFEDINQINEDGMEEMDIKWNMALLSMRADKTLEFYNESNKECIETLKKKLETLKQENEGVNRKLAGLLTASKDLDHLIESQRLDKNKEGLGYIAVPPPPAQLYLSPKKDLSWTGLPECADDTITDYSRASPTVKSTSKDGQNRNPFVSEDVASPITPKPFIKFVKPKDCQSKSKTDKKEIPKKPPVKYAKQYRKPNKKPNAHSYANRPVHRTSAMRSPYRAPWVPTVNKNYPSVNRKFSTGSRKFPTANRKFPTASRKFPTGSTKGSTADIGRKRKAGSSQNKINDKGYWDNGCSRHMTVNISYLFDYEPFDGGYVSFGQGGCKITGKGTIKTGKLEFDNVYFVKDLKYNLFSVSQIYDNKNSILFTDSECIVLGKYFKLLDDANILLRTPRQHNMYSINLNNIVPHRDLTCLVAKASVDEYMLWHRRIGHLNFKTMNELVRHNLVRGLPTKCFENDHTCTACLKGKQHKASFKSKLVNSVTKPLHTLHMDLFGPTSDETSGILKKFITEIENLKDLKVKIIRCDNEGEFRNKEMNNFCSQKGIKREFSNVGTPQQNGVAERRNRTLIEAARTMLADAKLLVTYWAEAVNTACYVQNKKGIKREISNVRTPQQNGTKDAARQEVKKDVSSLRYIALPNWAHDALLEFSSSKPQDHCSTKIPEGSGNPNPTASTSNPLADQMETLTVETPIPTVSSPVPTAYSTDSQEPSRVRPIGTKWVLKNKKDEIGIVIRNKARLVAQGNTQEEGIDYDEVFAHVARIEGIRLFLTYASFMGFTVYQMDVKSAFLYGTIDDEVYVMQPPGFQDPEFSAKVYKVEKAMYRLHQAPRAWYGT
nr:hypothetical protein [Tanacetum cinerariifolium]